MCFKLFISLSLIANLGLTLCQQIQNQTNGANVGDKANETLKKDEKRLQSPFEALFGLNPKSFFEEHDKAMDNMEKAFAEQEKNMNEEFSKIHNRMQNIFSKPKPILDEPILPWIDSKSEDRKDRTQSGLPVFDPNNGSKSPLKDTWFEIKDIFEKLKPIINRPEVDTSKPDISENPFKSLAIDIRANLRNKGNNKTDSGVKLFPFLDKIFHTFTSTLDHIFDSKVSVNTNDTNATQILSDKPPGDGWIGLQVVDCKCPEAKNGKHEEERPMHDMHDNITAKSSPQPKDDSEEKNRWSVMEALRKEGQQLFANDLTINKDSEINMTIDQLIRHEIKLTTDDEYKWYDWVLVSLITITSAMLFIMVALMCVKRTKQSKNVKINEIVAKIGEQKDTDNNCLKNENFNQKGIEKIKTIFVNMK